MNLSSILASRHWIFDLDGTLTLAIHDFQRIRSVLGVPETADILGYLDSLPAAEAGPLRSILHDMETELLARTTPADGTLRLLSHLSDRGASLGILTRNTRATALSTLEVIGAGEFFPSELVFGREDTPPKPDATGVMKMAAIWGVAPQETVMVGDYLFDLQTGRAAGAATVHVDPSRAFRWPELADLMVASLEELAEILEQEDPVPAPEWRGERLR